MENQYNYNIQQNVQYVPYGFTPETYAEKKDLRKRALIVGLPSLCFFGISFLWSAVYLFIMSLLGYGMTDALALIQNPAIMQVLQVVLSTLMFTVPYIVAVKLAGMRVSDLVPLEGPQSGTTVPFFLFGVGFCAFANIAVSYAGGIFESFGIDYSVDYGENPQGFWGFALVFISTAVVPALVEEFACRGIMFGALLKYGEGFALITTSAIFGMMHGNFEQIPFAFLVGLVLGFIRLKTGSLWVCVLVHGFNNLISVIFNYLPEMGAMVENIIYTVFLMASLAVAIYALCLLSGRNDVYTLSPANTAASERQKYKWFFASPAIIIFTVVCFIESLAFFV